MHVLRPGPDGDLRELPHQDPAAFPVLADPVCAVRVAGDAALLDRDDQPVLPDASPLENLLDGVHRGGLPDPEPADPADLHAGGEYHNRLHGGSELDVFLQPMEHPDRVFSAGVPRRGQGDAGLLYAV